MRASSTNVRFIKPSSILIGDTIKVEEVWEDATITKVGTVAKREHYTHGTEYMTAQGVVLCTDMRDNLTKIKVTLLKRAINVTELNKDSEIGVLF